MVGWHHRLNGHGEGVGEGEMYRKSNTETYVTIYKIDNQWEFAVWLRNSNRVSVSTWRGQMEREVQWGGDICIPMADSC